MEISQEDAKFLTKMAVAVCRKKFPLGDIEFESAVNLGIARAILNQHRYPDLLLSSLACLFAVRECHRTTRIIKHWQRQDQAAADRGYFEKPIPTPVDLDSFEILCFVARHGRTKAARMLGHGLTVAKINDILHDIAREMDASRDNMAVAV